ncbi:MAG: tRNA (adenosine(37)-N6)-dimethylallyltransferase MiaA [Bacteroidaceae bacterium]|jgi:tRNA dimethylallyltransferase|nr:tRNA (adenosine(37)-N6)-dimethylallyltransferase MiaA [Bacteroidaceae bacterium]
MTLTLIVILGPTAVGKTELTLSLAEHYACPILNCDSRQIYRDMRIGTAAPTQEQLDRVRHYFVGQLNLDEYYSAAKYEQEVLQLTSELFKTHNTLILSGGSMMYIDAVCNGIDDIPTVDEEVRATLAKRLQEEGLEKLLAELRLADPEHYDFVDHKNAKRVVHALEVCYTTGKPYSSFLTRKTLRCGASTTQTADRPFRILKIGLERPREELFARINSRVDDMINSGLLHEAMTLLPHRHENALNTVGYKEMFNVLDGTWELPMAIERLKKNTRVYAKKQMTWFKHDTGVTWFHPNDKDGIIKHINENLNIGE